MLLNDEGKHWVEAQEEEWTTLNIHIMCKLITLTYHNFTAAGVFSYTNAHSFRRIVTAHFAKAPNTLQV